jgi:RNA polymerase sigma-B factor
MPGPRTELRSVPTNVTPTRDQVERTAELGRSGDGEYDHLKPLLAEYAATPSDEPRRARTRERLVTAFLPVARNVARRYAQRGEPLEDLVQVASVGLMNAVDRFDPELGHQFLSFAIPTITGEIRRHFRDKTWSVRVPRRLKDLHLSINGVVAELSHQIGRAPRPSEIAARLDIPTADVLEALQAAQSYRAGSLDEMLTSEPDATARGDLFGERDPHFEQFTDSHSVAPHLKELPTRERNILIMRFYHDMTQTQIAERIGISQMQVSRLLSGTLARLRQAIDEDPRPGEAGDPKADRGAAGGLAANRRLAS